MADYAVLVGIDAYRSHSDLSTPVYDVNCLKALLARDGTDRPGWVPIVLEAPGKGSTKTVTKSSLTDAIDKAVARAANQRGQVLFYFAGHGEQDEHGEHHVLVHGDTPDEGDVRVSLGELVQRVHGNRDLKSATAIIDCCFSGGAVGDPNYALARDRAILTSSGPDHVSSDGSGTNSPFAEHLLAGLGGVAATLDGDISLTGLYEYVAKRFGRTDQRPQLQINLADEPIILRRVKPFIEGADLHDLFVEAGSVVHLTKEHEGEDGTRPYKPGYVPTPEQMVFDRLKALQVRGLLDTGGIQDLYWIAKKEPDGGLVRLSPLGQWYWHQRKLGWM